VLAHKVRELLP